MPFAKKGLAFSSHRLSDEMLAVVEEDLPADLGDVAEAVL